MTNETPHEPLDAAAVFAEELANGMSNEQLLDAWDAVEDGDNLTYLQQAVLDEIERRNLEI